MRGRRAAGAIVVVLLLALGLWLLFIRTPDDGDNKNASASSSDRRSAPTFPPLSTPVASLTESSVPTSSADASETTSTSAPLPPAPSITVVDQPTSATIADAVGDVTFSADPAPPWADLAGATLTRSAEGYELRVRLGGGSAPSTTDSSHTMNIASYYDTDGNGTIDYEVWANLANGGWGGSYFDDVGHLSAYADKSFVTVTVDGEAVVIRFPLAHLRSAATLRWSLASEWGRYEVIGSDLAARDDAPDNDAPAPFPG